MDEFAVQAVAMFGTSVVGRGERYILELRGLMEPLHFVNPKDKGTKYGDQYLKGDGQDILILNGVSKKQELMLNKYLYQVERQMQKPAEEMPATEVKRLLRWLEENQFNDRYCSDLTHKKTSYETVRGRICQKLSKPVRAAVLAKGDTFSDAVKTQEATRHDSLLIVDGRGIGHISNVPNMYMTLKEGATIIAYKDVRSLYAQYLRKNARGKQA